MESETTYELVNNTEKVGATGGHVWDVPAATARQQGKVKLPNKTGILGDVFEILSAKGERACCKPSQQGQPDVARVEQHQTGRCEDTGPNHGACNDGHTAHQAWGNPS